ncbi:uncharacterized protein LOC131148362 [Malania oleifera]|uniref:uncharacterized protein LOC131148362 n=1 Tax=Malania oleifera TaxID=397392 RepID=UPI0025ADED86|nr:uncharacterized protein LOC131148362 [Malania oleifera]
MGEDLYLYIASTANAVSSVLVREEGRQHRPIYYTSKVLSGAEKNYSTAEKAAFSIICVARKLRPYFQAHKEVFLDQSNPVYMVSEISSEPYSNSYDAANANDCNAKANLNSGKVTGASNEEVEHNGERLTFKEPVQGRRVEEFPCIIWAYHTTQRAATGKTPFMPAFGVEAIIPVEVGIPSWQRKNFDEKNNSEELRVEIDLLEERQEQASLKIATYQQMVAKYYNTRVRVRNFQPEDLVLRKA